MNTERPTPRTDAAEADKLKWESDIEVIGICKFPCVRNKKGTGVILTGHPGTEVQELAALHNEAIESIAAELADAREELARLKDNAVQFVCGNPCEQHSGAGAPSWDEVQAMSKGCQVCRHRELARLKAEPNNELRKTVLLRDYSEIIDHLQRCQDAEDEKLGDMGHSYFEQAITAIKDLQALVIDLTTHKTPAHPEPLTRPDEAGWLPIETAPKDGTNILALHGDGRHISTINYSDGHWRLELWGSYITKPTLWMPLPATPPPSPKKGVEG